MKIVFRVDASIQIGTGHIMRSLALAQACQAKGGTVCFVCAEITAGLEARLSHEGMEVIRLDVAPGSSSDIFRTIAQAKEINADWMVLDGYHFKSDYQKAIKDAGFRLLCIDDYGHTNHYHADLVLNQNISAEASIYKSREPYTKLLLGTHYALLRKEFWPWREWSRTIPEKARNILVTMGGSDPDNVTLKVIHALADLNDPNLDVRIIVGPGNPHLVTLQQAIDQNANCQHIPATGPCTIQLLQNVTDMPALMAWADIAISAGGSTCWELLFMQLPSAVFILAENQRPIVEKLHQLALVVNIGWHDRATVVTISEIIHRLCIEKLLRVDLITKCKHTIDGLGSERVVNAMQ